MTTPELQTERLLLKGIHPQFIQEQFRTQPEAAVQQFFNLDAEGFQLLKAMHEQGMETNRLTLFYFLLVEKETNMAIGDCGFHTWNKQHRKAELFYSLRTDAYRRKGYMSEALPVVIQYGFEQMNLHRIAAMVASYNEPSVRLIHKQGFVFEGVLREDYVVNGVSESSDAYSLLAKEWQERRK